MRYTSYAEQMAYLDFVMRQDIDGKPREIHIREAAEDAITRGETYTTQGFTLLVRHPRPLRTRGWNTLDGDRLPSAAASGYTTITVRLIPELQGSLEVARILVENQLRAEWP